MRFITALIVCTALSGVVSAQQIPVFVFAGQSNMVGFFTDVDDLNLSQQQPQARVLFSGQEQHGVNWAPMQPPTEDGFQTLSGQGFGPEVSAPLTISNGLLGQRVGAVKFALNNSGLRLDANDADWNPASGAELFFGMTSHATNAINQLPAQVPGTTGQVAGIFWMQGERDSTDLDRADVYQQNLVNFINSVRASFGNPSLPFVMGQIDQAGAFTETIRRAQANVARIVPNTSLVLTDDLAREPLDPIHFTSQSTYELGVRMGRAYLALQNPLPARPGPMNLAVNGGFEDYAVTKWMGIGGSFPGHPTLTTSLTAMPGWTGVNRGATLTNVAVQSDWGSETATPSEGSQFLSLQNGVFNPGGSGGISQTFATTGSGATNRRFYNVFFDYSALARGNNEISGFTYDVGGSPTAINVDTNGVGQFHMVPWVTHSFTFLAGSSSTTLRFLPTDVPDDSFFGASIDNVKIIQGPVWTGTGGNTNWNNNGNWNSGINPDDTDLTMANFLWTTTNTTVNLNTGRSVKSLRFDSPNSYTISGSNVLDLRSSSGNTSIIVANGDHTINSRINFNVSVDVDIAQGSTLTMNGTFTNNNTSTRALSKFGEGSLVLGHVNNTYNGPTNVVAGTLRLSNANAANNISLSPRITVYRGAVFDVRGLSGGGITLNNNQDLFGSGTVRGAVNATNPGINIAPGHSPGILTFDGVGNIALAPTTVLDFEVGGTGVGTGEAGYTYDQIVVDGSGKTFFTSGARLNLITLSGRTLLQPYTIVSAINGAVIDFNSLLRDLDETLGNGTEHTEGGWRYRLDYTSNAITLTFIPEPTSLALAGLGIVLLPRRRRR